MAQTDVVGLIPAAGRGVRLGLPYPKELYPVIRANRYKPISQFILENMVASGIEHIVFVINETKHQLIGYFGDGSRFGCRISYVAQEQREANDRSTSPGLAHALNSAYHLTRGQTVCFGMADTLLTPTDVFHSMLAASSPDDDLSLGLFPTDRPQKFGMVRMDGDGRVRQIVDKPAQTDLTHMWGVIVWRPRFTDYLRECLTARDTEDFARVMNSAIAAGMRARGVRFDTGTYVDLGTYEEIAELERQQHA